MIDTIEVVLGFPRHRKTRRLERALGNDARWLPVWLWLYTLENARDTGDLSHLTDDDLAAVLDYDGDAPALRAALIAAEFLDPSGHVVGWSDRYAQRFAFYGRRAKAAAERRWGRASQQQPEHPAPLPPVPPTTDNRPDLTGPDLKGPDLTLGSIAKHASSILEASQKQEAGLAAQPAAAADALTLNSEPPTKPARSRKQPAQADAEWLASLASSPAYAGLDVAREHAKASEWCRVRSQTLSRQRFINWLNRADKPLTTAPNAQSRRSFEQRNDYSQTGL